MRRPAFYVRVARALLRFPLLWKILVANTALIVVAVAATTALVARLPPDGPAPSTLGLIGLFALAVVAVSAVVNLLILRLALSPLWQLEKTAQEVQRGRHDARVPSSAVADRELERLTSTFNRMLDALAAYRQRLRDVANRALQAAEAERKRIALELHDDTAQTLAALLIRLQVARNTSDPQLRDERLEEIRSELVRALESVRRFARALRPPALDEVGVVAAIREHARSLCETAALQVEVEADLRDSVLSPQTELVLYRIVQEALSNVVRHANARSVRVRIERQESAVVAEVRDDGKGFPVDEELRRLDRGLGLFGMQERAAYVGGSVDIQSRPGDGTTVRVTLPILGGNIG